MLTIRYALITRHVVVVMTSSRDCATAVPKYSSKKEVELAESTQSSTELPACVLFAATPGPVHLACSLCYCKLEPKMWLEPWS